MRWWEKQPLRIVEIVDCFDLQRLSPEVLAKTVKKMGGNVQHFHCMELSKKESGSGLDDGSLHFKTSVASKQNPDRLAQYLPYAKKYGIRVVVYFNVHWYTPDFGKKHPDWIQIKEDGSQIMNVYGTGTSFCINSPYREWVFQILRDLCKYDIDGIFYDGPIFFSNTCYCEYCKALFHEKTGENPPSKSNRNHSLWKEFIEFQAESMERFLEESNKIIKRVNPEILFYMNGNSNWPYWTTGRDNHRIIKHTDILGAEGGFLYGNLNQTPVFKPGLTGKLISSQADGKPTVVFDCAGHKPWSWYLLPEKEISILLYETCFSGSNYWIAVFPDDINQPEMKTISEFGDFIRKNPDPFHNTQSMSNIALCWSTKSAEMYTGSSVPLTDFTAQINGKEIGDLHAEFNGFYKALSKSHVPFDVIDDYEFDLLKKYNLVIFPNSACLSNDDCEKIREFVKQGGNIVASFETSLYDENGKQRENFGLSDVFGLNFTGKIIGPMEYDYVSFASTKKIEYLKGIKKKFFPAPEYGIFVEVRSAKPIIFFCKKLIGRYDGVPEISDIPMMTVNRYGKGNCIYLAGTYGATVDNFGFFEYLAIVRNFCNCLAQNYVVVENDKNIEIFLRKKENKAFLYMINLTCGLERPINSIEPLQNTKIILKGLNVSSCKTLKEGKSLDLIRKKGKVELLLPSLCDFEIIEISLKKSQKGMM